MTASGRIKLACIGAENSGYCVAPVATGQRGCLWQKQGVRLLGGTKASQHELEWSHTVLSGHKHRIGRFTQRCERKARVNSREVVDAIATRWAS